MSPKTAKKATAPKSKSGFSAETIALNAARQALAEYSSSPAQGEHIETIVNKTLVVAVGPLVVATLDRLGIDTSDPKALRKDMLHLRTWREIMDKVRDEGIGSTVKYVAIAVVSLLALGFGALVYRGH